NHFHPRVGLAAVEVLEALGFEVLLPKQTLCCGRPLYDFGMLDLARRQLRQILTALREPIAEGVPIVGLEPSCVSVFRDELVNLMPRDPAAQKLARQTRLFGELLRDHHDLPLPRLERRALV